MAYATTTTVSIEKSKGEIEAVLRKYGATKFASGWDDATATILFDIPMSKDAPDDIRRIQFTLPLPIRSDRKYTHRYDERSRTHKARTPIQAESAWEQACRSSWRSLLLVIKAMLEAVESGIVAFDVAFLPYTVLPSGRTVAETIIPEVESAYSGGLDRPITLALGSGR